MPTFLVLIPEKWLALLRSSAYALSFEGLLERFNRQLERLELIVLDELGYIPFSKAGAELLFEVVSRAYERTSLIMTTNLPFESWTEILGSQRLTAHFWIG